MEGFTEIGLPIVSKDTIELFARDFTIRECKCLEYISEQISKLRRENKNLGEFLGNTCREFAKDKDDYWNYSFVAVIAYELLRRQAEVNKLENNI